MTLLVGFSTLIIGFLLIVIWRMAGAMQYMKASYDWRNKQAQEAMQNIRNSLPPYGRGGYEPKSQTTILGHELTEKLIINWLRASHEPLGLDLTDKCSANRLADLIENGDYKNEDVSLENNRPLRRTAS